jgi:hypothetical protein
MRKYKCFLVLASSAFITRITCLTLASSSPASLNLSTQTLRSRQFNVTIPENPPWAYPSTIVDPPRCMSGNSTPVEHRLIMINPCSATKCVETEYQGQCVSEDTFVDTTCLCQPFNTQSQDSHSNCSTVIQKAQCYAWLNGTCGNLAGWRGLPSDWKSFYLSMDVLLIGTDGNYLESGPENIFPRYSIPDCVSKACPSYNASLSGFLLTEGDMADAAWSWPLFYMYSYNHSASGLYLSRTDVCSSLLQSDGESCSSMCSSKLQRAEYLLWLNSTCSGAKAFSGMPANWATEVTAGVGDATYHNASDLVFPDCVVGECGKLLSSKKDTSSEVHCVLDLGSTYCSANVTQVSYPQFCANFSYPSTCQGFCTKSYERSDLLKFTNNTCSNVTGWSGLPANWTDLLNVLPSDLKPWPEVIRNHNTNRDPIARALLCPSPEANIGVFAAINVTMLLLTPFFGRRKVVEWITFGRLGKAHSGSWKFMGPFMAVLQLLVNIANALIIKSLPGYSQVDVKTLVLLWCTRPRMAWMVIILIPYQAEEVMYFNCAASSLFSELILQLLSSYTFGTVANYARSQHFYKLDHRLDGVLNGNAAKLMYAGALFWLIVVIFCLIMVFFSIIGVDKLKGSLADLARLSKRHEGNLLRRAKKLQVSTKQRYSHLQTLEDMIDDDKIDHLSELIEVRLRLMESCDSMVQSLLNLAELVQIEEQEYRKKRSHLKKLESKNSTPHEEIARSRSAVEELRVQLERTSRSNVDSGMSANQVVRERVNAAPEEQRYQYQYQTNTVHEEQNYEMKRLHDEQGYRRQTSHLKKLESRNNTPYEVIADARSGVEELKTRLETASRSNVDSVMSSKEIVMEQIRVLRRRLQPNNASAVGRVEQQWRAIEGTWLLIEGLWEEILSNWHAREKHLRKLEEHEGRVRASDTTATIFIAFLGMFGCWLSQWIFWGGLVHLYSNQE